MTNGGLTPETHGQRTPKARTRLAVVSAAIGLVVVLLAIAFVVGRSTDRSDASGGSSSSADLSTVDSASSSSGDSSAAPSSAPPSSSPAPASSAGSDTSAPPTVVAQSSVPATAMSGQPGLPVPTGVEVLVTSSLYHTDSQKLEVVSSVTGVATTTGSCTAFAVLGSAKAQASMDAVFDGRGTSCGSIMIPMQGQPKGNWAIHVEFTFSGGIAKSESVVVAVK